MHWWPLTRYVIVCVLTVVAGGAVLGFVLGHWWIGALLALAAVLAWQLWQLRSLDHWLRHRSSSAQPQSFGRWEQVSAQIVRLHQRKRFHREQYLKVYRDLRDSMRALQDGVVLLNQHGEIQWFNAAAMKLLGLRRVRDRGVRLSNLLREPRMQEALLSVQPSDPIPWVLGDGRSVQLGFQSLAFSENQRLLWVHDLTQQVAVEKMRQDFVANASHELRSPLTVMTGYLETLLSEDELPEELRQPLREMQRQTTRMNSIVADLLELSRLEAQVQSAGENEILMEHCLLQLQRDARSRKAPPEIVLELLSPAYLLAQAGQIESAFSNLVDNAVKYTPEEGTVTLRWSVDADGTGRFCVQDTGPGIAPEHVPRLTERFYRADAGRARSEGGTGLGLAIVKHILELHSAVLEIRSELGVGSSFCCVFPPERVRFPAAQASHPENFGAETDKE